jgi:hypothetical protein
MPTTETAFQTQYRQEFIAGFEQRQSLLRDVVTTEAVIKGNQATFLVADSDGDVAVTRGNNGLIPARADVSEQFTATLVEWHDLRRKTRFNIFASQSDQRRIMQMNSMSVMNRKIDSEIITTLDGATVELTVGTASASMVLNAKTMLGNAGVPWDSNIIGLITPAFEAELMEDEDDFKSRDYVGERFPWNSSDMAWRDRPLSYVWAGVQWIVHPNLTGVGTGDESCYMFHKSAIGHAVDTGGMQSRVGYDDEQDYSYARTSIFMGSVILQDSGIVRMQHNGTAMST